MKKKITNVSFMHRLAKIISTALCAILFICANTNSCAMIHQPEIPDGLNRYSKVK